MFDVVCCCVDSRTRGLPPGPPGDADRRGREESRRPDRGGAQRRIGKRQHLTCTAKGKSFISNTDCIPLISLVVTVYIFDAFVSASLFFDVYVFVSIFTAVSI